MDITVRAYAKINLTLDVTGKRDDGYHLIDSVMQSIGIYDTVTVELKQEGGICVTSNNDELPNDESNIAVKAAKAFFESTGMSCEGISIKIKKNIPIAAGLAGGSADGAAVIVALNELLECNLTQSQLCKIGEKVGADVPFCILGGTRIASGIGNILSPLPDIAECYIVLARPEFKISTAQAYSRIDQCEEIVHPNTELMGRHICSRDIVSMARQLGNVFHEALPLSYKMEVDLIREAMIKNGALGACMSGSGPSVFAIFDDKSKANDCEQELKKTYGEVFLCSPVNVGCRIKRPMI